MSMAGHMTAVAGDPLAPGGVDTPPEVSNLEFPVQSKEQIFGLDVAVDDVLLMQVRQGVCHLVDVLRRIFDARCNGPAKIDLPGCSVDPRSDPGTGVACTVRPWQQTPA